MFKEMKNKKFGKILLTVLSNIFEVLFRDTPLGSISFGKSISLLINTLNYKNKFSPFDEGRGAAVNVHDERQKSLHCIAVGGGISVRPCSHVLSSLLYTFILGIDT